MNMYEETAIVTALQRVKNYLLTTESDLQAIVCRGSFITGRMSPTSDVDMYLITTVTGPQVFHLMQDGIDFHIRRFPESYLLYEIEDRNLRYIGFFRHAEPLHDPYGVYAKLKEIVDHISPIDLTSKWLTEVKHQALDIEGQIEIGDYQTALYLLRFGAHLLAQTALLLTPEATYKHKDVVASLRESFSLEPIADSLLDLMDLDEAKVENVESKYAFFKSAMTDVERLLTGAQST